MAGSPRSTRKTSRLLGALVALLALIASACGGTEATETAADQLESAVVEDSAVVEPVSNETAIDDDSDAAAQDDVIDEDSGSDDSIEDVAAVDDSSAGDATDSVEGPSSDESTDAAAGAADPLSQVLAFALEASESQSYSFTQGMAMRMNVAGLDLSIAPNEAYVFGEVEGNTTHIRADIGVIMAATFDSLGIDTVSYTHLTLPTKA